MSEDLRLMISSTEGEGPSEKFAAELREMVVARSNETRAVPLPLDRAALEDPTILDFEFQTEREKKMNVKLIVGGLIAAAVLVIAGFVAAAGGGTNEKLETIDEDPVTPTTEAFEVGAEPSAETRAVIERLFTAESWEETEAAFTPGALVEWLEFGPFNQDQYEDFLAASKIFGSTMSLDTCQQMTETVVQCQVISTSAITEAMGDEPFSQPATFNLADGKITTFPNLIRLAETETFRSFARDAGIDAEREAVCRLNYFDPPCAQFMMDNLDDWVAWDKDQQ